jgi:hypothetical protein
LFNGDNYVLFEFNLIMKGEIKKKVEEEEEGKIQQEVKS